MAILEVCGFNDWLIEVLRQRSCREIVLIHPEKPSKRKTDRRDAHKLCELLWLNRDRLAEGLRLPGLRRVYIPTAQEAADRQLTALRQRAARQRTRTLNQIQGLLRKHNLMWDYPTKTFQTQAGRRWLQEVSLSTIDRLEMNLLLAQWELWEKQVAELDEQIAERCQPELGEIMSDSQLLTTVPGISHYAALAITSRIGPVERFPSPRSLSNYFGLTPGCRNSGESATPLGSDHQGRQRHGPLPPGPGGDSRAQARPRPAPLVPRHQGPPWFQDRPCGGDATARHDPLAHAHQPRNVPIRRPSPFAKTSRRPPLRLHKRSG